MPRSLSKRKLKKLTHYIDGSVKCTIDTLRELSDKDKFDDIVSSLKGAFQRDLNVEEACCEAGINKSTFYSWINASDDFANTIKRARQRLKITAKKTIADKLINKDLEVTKWWLERRAKDEFSIRHEMTGKDGTSLLPATITFE